MGCNLPITRLYITLLYKLCVDVCPSTVVNKITQHRIEIFIEKRLVYKDLAQTLIYRRQINNEESDDFFVTLKKHGDSRNFLSKVRRLRFYRP
jgi:hypothetical protein